MKTNFKSILLVLTAATIVASAVAYITILELRARRLETRLALVETALYASPKTPPMALRYSTNGTAQLIWKPQSFAQPSNAQLPYVQNSLEGRIEQIERELSPHLQLLELSQPASIGIER